MHICDACDAGGRLGGWVCIAGIGYVRIPGYACERGCAGMQYIVDALCISVIACGLAYIFEFSHSIMFSVSIWVFEFLFFVS